MDECEGLMGQLEKQFVSPDASPADIASRVADMSSSSVTAPRTLSAPLLQKLDLIAEDHHGTVPLHGRMFAQWMHHAFPRECPFPHVAGSTDPKTAGEWMLGLGYCDARCSRDLRWVNDKANVIVWKPSETDVNAGTGKYGSCCTEIDIWEASKQIYGLHHARMLS